MYIEMFLSDLVLKFASRVLVKVEEIECHPFYRHF